MRNKHLKLFANCIVVKGAANGTICDLHRGRVYSIPLELAQLLDRTNRENSWILQYNKFIGQDKKYLDEYIDFIIKNELGFWTNEPELFPSLINQWSTPEIINNVILELEGISIKSIKFVSDSLLNIRCKYVELRFYSTADLKKVEFFMDNIQGSLIRGVVLILPSKDETDIISKLNSIISKYPRILRVLIHSYNSTFNQDNTSPKLHFTKNKINSCTYCGNFNIDSFSIKIPVYMESLQHNTCLNKKISIDKEGNIKNCPSMGQSFGNIKNTTLEEALDHPNFKKYWNITKDQISVCKDCEFRYVCTDCRAYTETAEDIYAKPLKCGYDPYTGEWEEWSTHPMKQKAIDYYEMRELVDGKK